MKTFAEIKANTQITSVENERENYMDGYCLFHGGKRAFTFVCSIDKEPHGITWEHVSISVAKSVNKIPTWEEMCAAKKLFWNDDEENNDKNSQAIQSKMAVATGGMLGVGAGNSKMKNFLPMAFSDFIFAIILEEYGLWGGIIVILAYLGLLSRAIVISKSCVKVFHIYTLLGLAIMITLQAAINMCVAVGILPVTGQTLPLISMGGSSSMFIGCALGLMLSISAEVQRTAQPAEAKSVVSNQTNKEDYDDDTTDFDAEE